MTSRSNLHGRTLEYLITDIITVKYSGASLTKQAQLSQARDAGKLKNLHPPLLAELNKAACGLNTWLNNKFNLSNQTTIDVDRLPDKSGNVTDICLTLNGGQQINLSLKHNHKALKHQRPFRTPLHCGYSKTSSEMVKFQTTYQGITQNFMQVVGGVKYFKELPNDLIKKHLYIPVCELVSNFVNTYSSTCSSNLFQYLVCNNYYKIVVNSNKHILEIQEFAQITNHTQVIASNDSSRKNCYIDLTFNNDWIISMRLHSASSKLKTNPSLKFDTKAKETQIPFITIPY